mmetsp:Transcript_10410/g.38640  ORF Transcript_10410/g.38640 Transcript_10410/m.38640 type:complete len:261 (+) Transcript_10410:961-1743(+)
MQHDLIWFNSHLDHSLILGSFIIEDANLLAAHHKCTVMLRRVHEKTILVSTRDSRRASNELRLVIILILIFVLFFLEVHVVFTLVATLILNSCNVTLVEIELIVSVQIGEILQILRLPHALDHEFLGSNLILVEEHEGPCCERLHRVEADCIVIGENREGHSGVDWSAHDTLVVLCRNDKEGDVTRCITKAHDGEVKVFALLFELIGLHIEEEQITVCGVELSLIVVVRVIVVWHKGGVQSLPPGLDWRSLSRLLLLLLV